MLLPYTYPTPKLSPHRRRCISTFPPKTHTVWFISVLNYGDTENVLINHLLLVIPMSYPCHYTNLCPHKPLKHAHTHTHTHIYSTACYCGCNFITSEKDVLKSKNPYWDFFIKLAVPNSYYKYYRIFTKVNWIKLLSHIFLISFKD